MRSVLRAICGQLPTKVHADVVLEHQGVGELTLAQRARVLDTCVGGSSVMCGQVRAQTTFGGEGPPTYFTRKGAFSKVGSLMKAQGSGTA